MKRAFLVGLGIEAEKIEAIMKEHGKSVSEVKDQLDTAKNDLSEANTKLEKFKDVDVDALRQQVQDAELAKDKAINDFKIDVAIEKAFTENKVKHTDLLTGKLDRDKLKFDKDGVLSGLDEQMKALKETYADLFGDVQPTPEVKGATPQTSSGEPQIPAFNFGFTKVTDN